MKGTVKCEVFDYDESQAYARKCNEFDRYQRTLPVDERIAAWDKWTAENPEPKPVHTFAMPLERGFSDTAERRDVEMGSELDWRCAIDEKCRELKGVNKVYPWMLRDFISADELGIEEEEFERELEEFCA